MSQDQAISKLLAGVSKVKQPPTEEFVGEDMPVESNEDSGIMEVQYQDETTSPEEGSSRKGNRTARKCKWCENFARGASNLCARHGGGRRCHCGKLARGPSNLCMKHGGGRRCTIANCNAASVYKSDYCRAHGGGKRCVVEGCVASVYSSKETHCFKHGGGFRCQHEGGCNKAPVGKTHYCIRHGGGRRCSVDGCVKGAVCEGMCVKHHQDAYKLETRTDSAPSSPLKVVSTIPVTIREDISTQEGAILQGTPSDQ